MKANEFRIGNWAIDEDGNEFQIEELTPHYNNCQFRWEWLKKIKPIPTTEEWLIRAGFTFDENKGFEYIDDDGQPQKIEDRPYWYLEYSDEDNHQMRFIWYPDDMKANNCPCEYVHHLQNAYFALTGEELDFKVV